FCLEKPYTWRNHHKIFFMANFPDDEAIDIVFKTIALSDKLSKELVLKGGNALKKVFDSPRASTDLDFSNKNLFSNKDEATLQNLLDAFCQELDENLKKLIPDSTYEDFYVQLTEITPPNVDFIRSWHAFEIKLGYSTRPYREGPYSDHVKLEISFNDIVCEDQIHEV